MGPLALLTEGVPGCNVSHVVTFPHGVAQGSWSSFNMHSKHLGRLTEIQGLGLRTRNPDSFVLEWS